MKIAPDDHRPWPAPARRPALAMVWHDLLFAHWAAPLDALRAVVPAALDLDTFEGRGYIGVVPFRMTGVRAWGLPGCRGLSSFPELNVRTYVTCRGKPGVYFLSLDAHNRLAVRVARRLFHLRYMDAVMRSEHHEGWVHYRSRRVHRGAPGAEFAGRYRGVGPAFRSGPATLEAFLTERYCMYMVDPRGRVRRGEVHHEPWALRRGEAHLERNTMAQAAGVAVQGPPEHLLFAQRLAVPAWWAGVVR